MYSLYYQPFSCSLAVHIALEKIGEPYVLIPVNLQKGEQFSADYLAVNPYAQVPTLTWGKQKMTQAGAILLWLDEQHPRANLLPNSKSGQRAAAIQMLFYLSNTLHPLYSRLFYPERFSPSHKQEVKETAKNAIQDHLHQLNHGLSNRDFLCGDTACAADYYFLATCNWMTIFQMDLSSLPNIQRYLRCLKQNTEVYPVLEKERAAYAA